MTTKKKASFEENYRALEQAIASLEGADLPLEEALSTYAKAAALLSDCYGQLKATRQTVEEIKLEGMDDEL